MINSILASLLFIYFWSFFKGFVWVLHAIFVVGGVVMRIGVDLHNPSSRSLLMIALRSFVAIPALGFLSIGPKKYFDMVKERLIQEMMESLISKNACPHVRNAFESSVRANLSA